jgi:predicted acyltransferase
MAAMVIVNTPGDWSHVYPPLLHADWNGWTPTDLIFPFFVFIIGVSIVLSDRSRGSWLGIVRRAVLLYAFGLALALYPSFNFSTVRVVGVLPRLAACYLAAAVVYRSIGHWSESRRLWVPLLLAGALLAGYWLLLTRVAAPGGVVGDLSPEGNLGAWIDRTVIGEAHLWKQSKTWDPEGLLSTLPAIATALTGIGAGVVLRGARSTQEKVVLLAAAGSAALIGGLAWDATFPINKNLWTSSYVLLTSGMAAIALAAGHWLIDERETPASAAIRPFVVLGRNALVLFVLSGWLVKTLIWIKVGGQSESRISLYNWIYQHIFAPLAAPKNASLLFAVAALVILYSILEVLHRRRWYLRV